MVKAKLHELAQKGDFDPPNYRFITIGPPHAQLFEVTLSFNGREFQSLGSFSTLREAKYSAANEALYSLSEENKALMVNNKSLFKNLLQELALQGGIPPPSYTTSRSGPAHEPIFQSSVVLGFVTYVGDCASTKKEAEQNAAMIAWFTIKNQIEEKDRLEAEERKKEN